MNLRSVLAWCGGASTGFVVFGLALTAEASFVYEYQGLAYTEAVNNSTPEFENFTNDGSMSVSGMIELGDALVDDGTITTVTPLAFSFSNGLVTFTEQSNLVTSIFKFGFTDGAITAWSVSLVDVGLIKDGGTATVQNTIFTATFAAFAGFVGDRGELRECVDVDLAPFGGTLICGLVFADSGTVPGFDTGGTWTVVSVPEPSTLAIFAFGLAGLGFVTRRRRTGVDNTRDAS